MADEKGGQPPELRDEKPPEAKDDKPPVKEEEKHGCCKLIICCCHINWYIIIPLLLLLCAYFAIIGQAIFQQFAIIQNIQCPLAARNLRIVEEGVLMLDTDGDGIPDHIDDDDDNDGILDTNDPDMNDDGILNSDINNNGIPDHMDVETFAQVSRNQSVLTIDTDRDGTPDVEDDDDDNDGIPDSEDDDDNGDGIIDVDTDNDGLFDFLDTDDDNDGIPDYLESSWTTWTMFSECSVTCGTGLQNRNRICRQPYRKGPSDCIGEDVETKECTGEVKNCPINGGWTEWSAWTDCSVGCGNSGKFQTRTCTNPTPEYGGKNCTGNDRITDTCLKEPCSGVWKKWSKWGSCVQNSCGEGHRTRTRICDPGNCAGHGNETKSCNKVSPDLELNGYFTNSHGSIHHAKQRIYQYTFISEYMKIQYPATLSRIDFFTASHSSPFYLSFWSPVIKFSRRSKESFSLEMKMEITPRRVGFNFRTVNICLKSGWYLGIHYPANNRTKVTKDLNSIVTVKKQVEKYKCEAYYLEEYDPGWENGVAKVFKKGRQMYCPAVILNIKYAGCHTVNFNRVFFAKMFMTRLEHMPKFKHNAITMLFPNMEFYRDGRVTHIHYKATETRKRVILIFYEPKTPFRSNTDRPLTKEFRIKKLYAFQTREVGVNYDIPHIITFRRGWMVATSYDWQAPGHKSPIVATKSVIPWKDLSDTHHSKYYSYYRSDVKKYWKAGQIQKFKRTKSKKVLGLIFTVKYDLN